MINFDWLSLTSPLVVFFGPSLPLYPTKVVKTKSVILVDDYKSPKYSGAIYAADGVRGLYKGVWACRQGTGVIQFGEVCKAVY
jgi:hypothetical protein